MDEDELNEKLANQFYTRLRGEIAKCESDIRMAEPDNCPHHYDIIYENKVRLDSLRTVLLDVLKDVREDIEEVEESA